MNSTLEMPTSSATQLDCDASSSFLPSWVDDLLVFPVEVDWELCSKAHLLADKATREGRVDASLSAWRLIHIYQGAARDAHAAAIAYPPREADLRRHSHMAETVKGLLQDMVQAAA